MKRILIVGGAGGIGLSMAVAMGRRDSCERVYIVDRNLFPEEYDNPKFECFRFDVADGDFSFFDRFDDIDALMITAGFGRLALFDDVSEDYIVSSFAVNAVAPIRIIHRFMNRLCSPASFCCGVMGSISGFMSSPLFAVYGATKAALRIFIESVNVELEKCGSDNRILNVSPGSIAGTSFYQGRTDLSVTEELAEEIISELESGNDLFIPQYDEIFKEVLKRYHDDFRAEGRRSYEYKLKSGRICR